MLEAVAHGSRALKAGSPLVQTKWGDPINSYAEKLLLSSALKEPANQRFLLLSDTGLPLYPPTLMWQQLMGETKSRINACGGVRARHVCITTRHVRV